MLVPTSPRAGNRTCRGIPQCGQNNTHNVETENGKITIATWNIRTLLDRDGTDRPQRRTAIVAAELAKYSVDIAALSETRLADEGSLEERGEGYTFFWRGLPAGARSLYGVAFAVRTSLLRNVHTTPKGISERLMTWRIPLGSGRHMTMLSAYAPTLDASDDTKDCFYGQLQDTIQAVPEDDKLLLMGDFNARVGRNKELWQSVLGSYGIGKCNDNGLRLLSLCSENALTITNTQFKLRTIHKAT